MKLKELLHGLDVLELHADEDLDITGVQYDSRQATSGDLFVAISGFQTDGHRYIPKAMENGAVCVVCEKKPETDIAYVLVPDARAALAALGANWFGHPSDSLCMIGITGTNGKTTSTYLLKHVLEKTLGAKVGLIGTIQNMIGDEILHTERTTPESFELQKLFAEMKAAGCTHVIMEVSSHALVLHRADQIAFRVGVFTNLTEDHLDFHKTMDACEAGDNTGLLLRGLGRDDVERGQVVAKPGSVTPHTKFEGEVYVLTKDEGGRHSPFFSNYRPQFYFRTTDVTGVITLPEGVEMVQPGDHATFGVELIQPIAMEEGLTFAVREGGHTVGSGRVTKIIE